MIKKLPEWYKLVSLDNSEEQLERRNSGISEALKSKDLTFYLSLVKLYYDKLKNEDPFCKKLTEIFLTHDQMFPQSNNKHELILLAGIILDEYISSNKINSIQVGIAFVIAGFGVKSKLKVHKEILLKVIDRINEESISIRKVQDETDEISINYNVDSITEISQAQENFNEIKNILDTEVDNNFNILSNKVGVLSEEVNILWWIVSEYSSSMDEALKNIKQESMPFIIGKELSELVKLIPGPVSAKGLISKALSVSETKSQKLKLKDSINSIPREWREEHKFSGEISSIQSICPLNIGILNSLEVEDKTEWLPIFKAATRINPNQEASPLEISYQFYLEQLYINSY